MDAFDKVLNKLGDDIDTAFEAIIEQKIRPMLSDLLTKNAELSAENGRLRKEPQHLITKLRAGEWASACTKEEATRDGCESCKQMHEEIDRLAAALTDEGSQSKDK